jgi:hypothetical protein
MELNEQNLNGVIPVKTGIQKNRLNTGSRRYDQSRLGTHLYGAAFSDDSSLWLIQSWIS